MLPITMSWAHCVSWYGTEVWYCVVWNEISYQTAYHTIPLTSTCTVKILNIGTCMSEQTV